MYFKPTSLNDNNHTHTSTESMSLLAFLGPQNLLFFFSLTSFCTCNMQTSFVFYPLTLLPVFLFFSGDWDMAIVYMISLTTTHERESVSMFRLKNAHIKHASFTPFHLKWQRYRKYP